MQYIHALLEKHTCETYNVRSEYAVIIGNYKFYHRSLSLQYIGIYPCVGMVPVFLNEVIRDLVNRGLLPLVL